MSSMKNLDDTVNFGDQFLYDKPTEDDQEKSKKSSSTKAVITGHSSSINIEATNNHQISPEIDSLHRPSAKRARLEQEMSDFDSSEDAMVKEVADKVKDHKRKHDSDDDEDDDDDEGPSAGSNQGRSTKRRRSDSAAFGLAQPPPKDDDQSSKKPRESDASASKQHPALTSTGWQITDTRDVVVDSSMHRSDPESEHSEQSSDDIPMQDEGHVSDMEDTDNAHIPKVSTTTWFKPIPESERPATPEPEWTIP
ncbi:hypothetical protein Tco_1092270 [Tanacetum coccineum]|uniref:Uncharacterized protein n=1 Tax=Tanacetum coccineum TaxID=301880 RepID=A0ABQ5I9C8_9ASTR